MNQNGVKNAEGWREINVTTNMNIKDNALSIQREAVTVKLAV